MRRGLALFAALVLAGCGAAPMGEVPQRGALATGALPPMKTFGAPDPVPVRRANSDLARDFIELAFFMESGREIPVLARFEGPVTLRVLGTVPPSAGPDLGRLLGRLQREAGIAITQVPGDAAANITVEFVPRGRMQALVPQAACFIVPNVTGWEDFRARRRSPTLDWTALTRRETVAMFVPSDVPPQEIRDCLHEELAQAVGPLNDLYRLPDSVWNDDNFQTVLTGFDILMLRIFNDAALRSGMTREAVAARLPEILNRLNPAGVRIAARGPLPRSPRAWISAVETALGPGTQLSARRAAAAQALAIAQSQGLSDGRLAFSYFTLGRLARSSEAPLALQSFLEAAQIYRALPGGEVHAAHVDMHLAAFALSAGRAEDALAFAMRAQPAAIRSENAALLSTLKMVQAEALDLLGRADDARTVRIDSLGWARYGFGSEARVRQRLAEIAALVPTGALASARMAQTLPPPGGAAGLSNGLGGGATQTRRYME
jgi:hypothetical protein